MRRVLFATLLVALLPTALPGAVAHGAVPVEGSALPFPSATGVSGPTLRALTVEGEFGALVIPDSPELNPRDNLTIEAWIKREALPGCGTILGKNRNRSYWFGVCDGRLRFHARGNALPDGNTVLPEGRWVHVAVTYDGQNRVFYVDGDPDGTAPAAGPVSSGFADLRIGADAEPGAFFLGTIDEVRLWNTARTAQQIRANALRESTRETGLVAAWALDGNGQDLLAANDAETDPPGAFTFDGALPRDVSLPVSNVTINVDGRCEPWEYGSAERVALDTAETPTVLLQISSTDIYVCFDEMERGSTSSAMASVYMDRDNNEQDPAQPGDYKFNVSYRGTQTVDEGDGVGGYRLLRPDPGNWMAARTTEIEHWSAEFRISRTFVLPPTDPEDDPAFGLQLSQAGLFRGEANWPVAAGLSQPSTWAEATLGDVTGELPRFRFTGKVRHEPEEDDPRPGRGIGDVPVELLTWIEEDDMLELVDVDVTDGGGDYELDYQGEDPDAFVLRSGDARGTVSVEALPGPGGQAAGANVVLYEIDTNRPPVSVDFDGTEFVDAVTPARRDALDQHYLIVYDAPVAEEDLWPLVDAKRNQGFTVVPMSAGDLVRVGRGSDLAEKTFNWLKDYWTQVEPDPVYALLVGRGDALPVQDVGWLGSDHRDPGDPDYYPRRPTDWFYADVDSGWDANNNGFYGEFLGCAPDDTYFDEEEEEVTDCPEEGSLLREGPFGELRGSEDDFVAEIAVGRIALNEAGEVRRALRSSVMAEASGSDDKRRGLLAGTLWYFEGSSWSPSENRLVPGGATTADPWVQRTWDRRQPFGLDAASALEGQLRPLVQPFMTSLTTLYETTSPGADPSLAPSAELPTAPLTRDALDAQWANGRNGLVFLAGNGSGRGMVAGHWFQDWNFNGRIDQPAEPEACFGQPVLPGQEGPPCWELAPESFADSRLPIPSGAAPVVFANAGKTGNVAWELDGADRSGNILGIEEGPAAVAGNVLGRGSAAAWIGSYQGFEPGSADALQAEFASGLMAGLRVGDALWAAQREMGVQATYDTRSYGFTLFGDPAMAYWGNTPDMNSPWPQAGGDWGATGRSRYAGPGSGQMAWVGRDGSPSSPAVIGGGGDVYAASRGGVVRFAGDGTRVDQASIPGASGSDIPASPAVGTDGVYVAAGSSLYSLDLALNMRSQVNLRGNVSGDPRVAPDGTVWIPTSSGMARVAGSGVSELLGSRDAVGAAVFLPNGDVAWSEEGGTLLRYHRDLRTGEGEVTEEQVARSGDITAPAVGSDGTVYVGGSDGRVYAIPEEEQGWQRDVGGPVQTRPVIADDGTLFLVTPSTVVALEGAGGSEVWRTRVALPVAAAPAVDGSRVFLSGGNRLMALDRATGGVDWLITLDNAVDGRGSPVIGADRTLFVLQRDNALVAIRESGWMAAPSGVTATANGDELAVSWRDNSANESGFLVEVCTEDRKCGEADRVSANTDRTLLRGLDFLPGEPLFVRVRALGRQGAARVEAQPRGIDAAALQQDDATRDSDLAWSRLAALGPDRPVTPSSLSVRATSSSSIELSWAYAGDTAELVGFDIGRSTSAGGPFENVAFATASKPAFADRDLQPNTEYFYEVRAVNEAGSSDAVAGSASTWRRTLAAPESIGMVEFQDKVFVRWQGGTLNVQEWVIERRDPGVAEWVTVGRVDAGRRDFGDGIYLDVGTYGYRVKAVGDETESDYIVAQTRVIGRVLDEAQLFLPSLLTRRLR